MINNNLFRRITASALACIITLGSLAAGSEKKSETVYALTDNQMSVLLAGNEYAGLSLEDTKNRLSQKYVLSTASLFSMFVYDSFTATNSDVEGRLAAGGNIFQETGNDTFQIGCGSDDYNIKNHNGSAHIISQGRQAGTYYKSFAYVSGFKPWESKENASDWFGNYLHPKTAVFRSDTEIWINNNGLLDADSYQYADADNNGNWLQYNVIDNSDIYRLGEGQKIIDFDEEFKELRKRSSFLSTQSTPRTWLGEREDGIELSYSGNDSPSVIYFNIPTGATSGASESNLYFDVPMSSRVVLNFAGKNPKTTSSYKAYFKNASGEYEQFENNDTQTKNYLYNFYEAENLLISNSVFGTVFAPYAKVTGYNGHVSGGVIAYSFYGSTEIGHTSFVLDSTYIPGIANGYVAGVAKVNENGQFVAGAELSLYEADPSSQSLIGAPLDTWISDGGSHIIPVEYKGSEEIRWYGIKETKAPAGYELTEDIFIFSVSRQTRETDLTREAELLQETAAQQESDFAQQTELSQDVYLQTPETKQLTYSRRDGGAFYFSNTNIDQSRKIKSITFTFTNDILAGAAGFIGSQANDGTGWMGFNYDEPSSTITVELSNQPNYSKFDFNEFELQIWRYTDTSGNLVWEYEQMSVVEIADVYITYDDSSSELPDAPETPSEPVPEKKPVKAVTDTYTVKALDGSLLGTVTATTYHYDDGSTATDYSGQQATISILNKKLPSDISLSKTAQSIGSYTKETSDENWVYLDKTDNADGDYIIDLKAYDQTVKSLEITAIDFNEDFACDIYFNSGKAQQLKIEQFSGDTMTVNGGWWNQPDANELITIRTKELWWGYTGEGNISQVKVILNDDTEIICTTVNTQKDFVFTEDKEATLSGEYTGSNNAVMYKITVSGNNLALHPVTDILPEGIKFLKLMSPTDKLTYTETGSEIEFKFNSDIDASYSTYDIVYLCEIQDTSAVRYINRVYADDEEASAQIKQKTYHAQLEIIKKYINGENQPANADPFASVVIGITKTDESGGSSLFDVVMQADENGAFSSVKIELTVGYTYKITEIYSSCGSFYSMVSPSAVAADGVLTLIPEKDKDYVCEITNKKSINKIYSDSAENKLYLK
ncbi:MAG: choice-of-anchor A family protein [Oscillospiraceae bacterium]|nr:choice-of-anchor A family protein [Oscillospiraceae bacterium]